MALPPAFLDELRVRTPLHGLIGRRTRLARNGRQWKGCCPFHNEKTPSFYVYDDHFHCFGCGAHGDAITFLMRAEGATFPEAVERLAAETGMQVPKPTPQAAARERRARDLHGVLAAAEAAYRRRLFLPEGRPALDYLRRRGLSDETIARFGLGWSGEGRGALAAELKSDGIEPPQLVAAGLMKQRDPDRPEAGQGAQYSDMFFGRVMFPIRDRRGRTISFGGRILGDGQPKYVNGPETELFRKRQGLYGLDLAREGAFRGAPVLVVEGYMDVIALHQAGFAGAVAPLGTALTSEQLELLWQLSPEPVLCFDGDAAGARAAARAAETALPLLTAERSLKLAALSGGEDPDTLLQKGGPRAFQPVLDGARTLSAALFDLLAEGRPRQTPEQRAALRGRLEEAARAIPDRVLSGEYRRTLLDRFWEETRRAAPGPGRRGGGAPWAGRPAAFRIMARPAVDSDAIRRERARNLLAILVRHPLLLPEVEEALMSLDLPAGEAEGLRAAMLAWLGTAEPLDSAALTGHLAQCGMGNAVTWATRATGLCAAAQPTAQPKEALDGWWHFFGLLRGEADLVQDLADAQRQLTETYDPAAQQRLIRLKRALDALRRGETESDPDEAAEGEPGEGPQASRASTIG
ncbi:DNA primase [Paracraurococcus ruber]|uniref:DNA primase n=1 Tax=Paracraurococcus ruber TaxID=77675 RepID=A0ABS1CYZ9_9PROT|nr:DNA primase [Paracraurococcus ruber]MBK1659523.1 DNA primase [Paracraurococcus ruber]TDG33040.1 DNA primase [Paracraurococcus ruber]